MISAVLSEDSARFMMALIDLFLLMLHAALFLNFSVCARVKRRVRKQAPLRVGSLLPMDAVLVVKTRHRRRVTAAQTNNKPEHRQRVI